MIIHLDMDAFFAQVEQMDRPELRGRPVIIGGDGPRGVVSTASYEARAYGVHSAMPMSVARRLCPHATCIRGNYKRYSELSRAIMASLGEFSPLVEPASIDEAYMDASGLELLFGSLAGLIEGVKARVREVSGGLTCSVGAAPVKFLAKMCSEVRKPDGVFILQPEETDAFLLSLPVERLPGVGRQTAAGLHRFGILTVEQARRYSEDFFITQYGKWGQILYERLYGRDSRAVAPVRVMKSESSECTFDEDTRDAALLQRALLSHAERVGASLRRCGKRGRTVTLKIRFADFRQITRSHTLDEGTNATQTIYETGRKLLSQTALPDPVRLVGLGVSGFAGRAVRVPLPGVPSGSGIDQGEEERRNRLDRALDVLRERFGKSAVQRGALFRAESSGAMAASVQGTS